MDGSTLFYHMDRETFRTRICDCAFYANLVSIAKTLHLESYFDTFTTVKQFNNIFGACIEI